MIRKAKREEFVKIIELIKRYKKESNSDFILDKSMEKEELENIYVYEKDEKILGYMNFHMINFPLINGKEIYLSELIVDEDQRGSGIGGAFLNYLKSYAKENNIRRIMLNTFRDSKAYLTEFYIKNGFTERDYIANMILEF